MLGLVFLVGYVVSLLLLFVSLGQVGARDDVAPTAPPRRSAWPAVLVSSAAATLWFLTVDFRELDQTSALFVGVPAVLALVVMFGFRPRTAVGVTCKALTFSLLLSLLFLGEGILCIVMAAPLLYAVAIAIAVGVDKARGRTTHSRTLHSVTALALMLTSIEGVTPWTTLNRDVWVSESRIVGAPAAEVRRALLETPRFNRVLPVALRFGFPRPIASRVETMDTISGPMRWIIRFRGGETRLNGQEPAPGDLVLRLADARPHQVRWTAVSDDSHMTHFLRWRESLVRLAPIDEARTHVTWSLRYSRDLDPAWYFGPLEALAARQAAGYLIDAVATP